MFHKRETKGPHMIPRDLSACCDWLYIDAVTLAFRKAPVSPVYLQQETGILNSCNGKPAFWKDPLWGAFFPTPLFQVI